MGSYLPSKWFMAVIFPLASIGIVVGLFLLYTKNDTAAQTPETKLTLDTTSSIRTQVEETDSDHDGLKDWEEALWHSDPHNPDSDKDGTNDGTEVLQNRNPTKPAPNDQLPRLENGRVAMGDASSSGTTTPLTVTASAGRELFASYLTLKQTGQFNQANQDKMIQAIADEAQRHSAATLFNLTDLNLAIKTTDASMHSYRDQLAGYIAPLKTLPNNEMVLLANRLAKPDDLNAAKQFTDMLAAYKTAIDSLHTMSVPADAGETHLVFLNSLIGYSNAIEGMEAVTHDPIRAYASAAAFTAAQQKLKAAGQALEQYLTSRGLERL